MATPKRPKFCQDAFGRVIVAASSMTTGRACARLAHAKTSARNASRMGFMERPWCCCYRPAYAAGTTSSHRRSRIATVSAACTGPSCYGRTSSLSDVAGGATHSCAPSIDVYCRPGFRIPAAQSESRCSAIARVHGADAPVLAVESAQPHAPARELELEPSPAATPAYLHKGGRYVAQVSHRARSTIAP